MNVYISGPINGNDDYLEDFLVAMKKLAQDGHRPFTPTDAPAGLTYEGYMRYDLQMMLGCEAIYMLKGWEYSRGALCEFHAATMCGMEVMYE